jgi:hypothetical protein
MVPDVEIKPSYNGIRVHKTDFLRDGVIAFWQGRTLIGVINVDADK